MGTPLLPTHWVLAGYGNSARILVENMSKRSDRAQVMEIQGNHVAKAVLQRDLARALRGSDRPSRVASARRELAARGAECCTKIDAAASRQNRGEVT